MTLGGGRAGLRGWAQEGGRAVSLLWLYKSVGACAAGTPGARAGGVPGGHVQPLLCRAVSAAGRLPAGLAFASAEARWSQSSSNGLQDVVTGFRGPGHAAPPASGRTPGRPVAEGPARLLLCGGVTWPCPSPLVHGGRPKLSMKEAATAVNNGKVAAPEGHRAGPLGAQDVGLGWTRQWAEPAKTHRDDYSLPSQAFPPRRRLSPGGSKWVTARPRPHVHLGSGSALERGEDVAPS